MTTPLTTLGSALEAARRLAGGASQEEFAKIAGMSGGRYRQIIRGAAAPRYTLARLAMAAHLDIDRVLDLAGEAPFTPEERLSFAQDPEPETPVSDAAPAPGMSRVTVEIPAGSEDELLRFAAFISASRGHPE